MRMRLKKAGILACILLLGPKDGLWAALETEDIFFTDSLVSVASLLDQQNVIEAPASVSVITADEIRRFGYKNLQEALMSVPGVTVVRDAFQRPRVVMRGIDSL